MTTKVEVHVRCRPVPDGTEQIRMGSTTSAGGVTLTIAESRDLAVDGTAAEKEYQLDGIWAGSTSQDFIFESIARPIVDKVLDGFNGTVCCYGATGTGKSYTTFGEKGNEGMVPRTINYLFKQQQLREGSVEIQYVISFLEIYLDKTYDLLDDRPMDASAVQGMKQTMGADTFGTSGEPSASASNTPVKPSDTKTLQLRETSDGSVYAEGLSSHPVASANAMLALLKKGINRRVTFGTLANERSSRSHAIFSVAVVQNDRLNGSKRSSILTFADLAGSERLSKSASDGSRKLEAASINRSLSALGNVVQSLAKGLSHIPYRDSKLTRILQHALGGSCHTTMICTIYPLLSNYDEVVSTIQFAHRCRNIINQPKVSVIDLSSADLESRVRKLTAELAEVRTKLMTEEELRRALQTRMNEVLELIRETGEYTIGSNGEILDANGKLVMMTKVTANSRASSAHRKDGSDYLVGSPKRRRSASRVESAQANKALQNSLSQVQAKLEQRSHDLHAVQEQSRMTKDALVKQIGDQRQEISSLSKELNAVTRQFKVTIEQMQQKHEKEIKRLLENSKAFQTKNTKLINTLPKIAHQYAEESRSQAELESNIRCAIESEKSTFAVELDCMMINQREELTKHFQYELNVLQMRLKEVEESHFFEKKQISERMDKLLEICGWFQKEYNKLSTVIHECCEGKHAAVLLGTDSRPSSRPRTRPSSRPTTGSAKKPTGASNFNATISEMTDAVEASEQRGSGVKASTSTLQPGDMQNLKNTAKGFDGIAAEDSNLSVGGIMKGETAPYLPGYVRQVSKPTQHVAIILPLELMPIPIPLEYTTFMRSEQDTRNRERASSEDFGPVSPPRGGTPIVTNPSIVTPSRPFGSVGLSTVRPYSNYSAKPYEYTLSSSGAVKKVRPRTAPKMDKFITSLGSPTRYPDSLPATRIVDSLNNYSIAQTQKTSTGSTLAVSKLDSLNSLVKAGTQRPSSTAGSIANTTGGRSNMLPVKNSGLQSTGKDHMGPISGSTPQISSTRKRPGEDLALSNLQESPCLNISSINSALDQPSTLTTEQMLRLELEREKQKSRRLQQATIHQQYLLNAKVMAGVDRSITRQSKIEIYQK